MPIMSLVGDGILELDGADVALCTPRQQSSVLSQTPCHGARRLQHNWNVIHSANECVFLGRLASSTQLDVQV